MVLKLVKVRSFEIGLYFKDGEFLGLLEPGRHWFFNLRRKIQVELVSQRAPWLVHEKLDMIVKSGVLEGRAVVLDLKDYERALVWIDGRFSQVVPPGLSAYWTKFRDVKVEVIDARGLRLLHPDLPVIVKSPGAERLLETITVPAGHVGAYFRDGNFVETLPAGRHVFWKNLAEIKVVSVETRAVILDVAGQEIMTADKVTLPLNALVAYRIMDVRTAVS
ncbi:MAG: SPFH domain-containing protein, partial [Gemmataceae bacterium]|nr:SPFH domain-containing protein [Gemmataceae bacterium]